MKWIVSFNHHIPLIYTLHAQQYSYEYSSFTRHPSRSCITAAAHRINKFTYTVKNVFLSDVILMQSERLSEKNICHQNNAWDICVLSFRFGWHNITYYIDTKSYFLFALIVMLIFSSVMSLFVRFFPDIIIIIIRWWCCCRLRRCHSNRM